MDAKASPTEAIRQGATTEPEPGPRPNRTARDEPLVVAAFDFDGTLTRGGSVWKFLVAMRGPLPVARAALRHLPSLLTGALTGGPSRDRAKERVFHELLGGMSKQDLARRSETFGLNHYRRHSRQDTRARLEWHKQQGHAVVLVSASPECYIEPVARELGAKGVIATRFEVGEDELLTGRFDGANCRGRHKAERLAEWCRLQAGPLGGKPVLWAYGNSAGDRAMLESADYGVNAGRLGRLGRLRGFWRLRDLDQQAL
jgi:phosphatidylglycerophosphatase C